ncbi:Rv2231c family pyridoxal phosphate-dependent protein CobC [Corynebacterium sp. sy039]|uniref:Rv2231c family pyridoxal phosphate-dependent protein CobC n=1 Tax=Corynebacterium sp. sy039 TaxID=2599641 RepID=UPI0011B6279F|nr:Rv2231c family pyridoxal phosphate-dependent protein CobC [Corynebacterium sp. sy039]QDZ42987.1 threonine-phosphate decarboxylase [Corynebacterium sp. sy039]
MTVPPPPTRVRIHGDEDARGATLNFSVNVLDNMPPTWLQESLAKHIPTLSAYPDARLAQKVRTSIAQYHNVHPENVLLLNGAAEGFSLLPRLAQKPAIIHPGFSEPELIFHESGVESDRIILQEPFKDLGDISEQLQHNDNDLVIIGNPTNPTGVLHDRENIAELATHTRVGTQQKPLLVVDEAFLDIVPNGESYSMAAAISSGEEHIIVLRSLTKTWGLAGLRIGYALASTKLIAQLERGRMHWPLGSMQLAAAAAVYERGITQLPQLQQQVAKQREAMQHSLSTAGFRLASDSLAPFLLVKVPHPHPEPIRQALLQRGIAIRRCDTFPGLGVTYWRLAVREQSQVKAFLAAFAEESQRIVH